MLILRRRAYARAGLVGNPSDGYHGRTISIIVRNFNAEVVLYEWDDVELVWSGENRNRFRSVHDLVRDVKLHGYYGGMRLLKATVKKFVEYCTRQGHALHDRNFSLRHESTIPRQVGLAGSSAIIVAALRCLMDFYGVRIRFQGGDPAVVRAMGQFASLAAQAREALLASDPERLARLMNENFDTRRSIYQLPAGQVRMVETARSVGASAKFAGSGGAIVGSYADEPMYRQLQDALGAIGCRVLKPVIT